MPILSIKLWTFVTCKLCVLKKAAEKRIRGKIRLQSENEIHLVCVTHFQMHNIFRYFCIVFKCWNARGHKISLKHQRNKEKTTHKSRFHLTKYEFIHGTNIARFGSHRKHLFLSLNQTQQNQMKISWNGKQMKTEKGQNRRTKQNAHDQRKFKKLLINVCAIVSRCWIIDNGNR